MDTSKIQIFTTGGTIDKSYFDDLSKYQFDRSKIGELIRHASVSLPFEITELMAKDSLELTDDDRERIAKAVSGAEATRIIITHGTDSMAVTAERLAALGLDKMIALTGAFLPARYADSDAVRDRADRAQGRLYRHERHRLPSGRRDQGPRARDFQDVGRVSDARRCSGGFLYHLASI